MAEIQESWADIPGYSGLYKISDQGRVKSVKRFRTALRNRKEYSAGVPERILKSAANSRGYYTVSLHRDGDGGTSYMVHHLVAAVFIGNRPSGSDVHHRDGNKANNSLRNLEYKDESDHIREHAMEKASLTPSQVREIRSRRINGETAPQIARDFPEISVWTIRNIVSGKRYAFVE